MPGIRYPQLPSSGEHVVYGLPAWASKIVFLSNTIVICRLSIVKIEIFRLLVKHRSNSSRLQGCSLQLLSTDNPFTRRHSQQAHDFTAAATAAPGVQVLIVLLSTNNIIIIVPIEDSSNRYCKVRRVTVSPIILLYFNRVARCPWRTPLYRDHNNNDDVLVVRDRFVIIPPIVVVNCMNNSPVITLFCKYRWGCLTHQAQVVTLIR